MKRPFTALSALGAAAHHAYELGAGVGLVFQPQMGLPGRSPRLEREVRPSGGEVRSPAA